MQLNLGNTVIQYLKSKPEQKFTARQMAQWIFENFPAECQEKKANSTFIKSDADLVQQIVAEISSQRPALQKRNPQVKTTEGRPRQYYWTEKSDQAEVTEAEDGGADAHLLSGGASLKESDLYPLLSEYLWSELRVYSKRIDEKKSSNKQGPRGNKWLYPDLVGMEDLTADWHQEVKGVVKEYADKKTTLWSFEVKMLLNRSNVREAFFQAVSNSSWAGETAISGNIGRQYRCEFPGLGHDCPFAASQTSTKPAQNWPVCIETPSHCYRIGDVAYWPLAPDHVLMADGRYRS